MRSPLVRIVYFRQSFLWGCEMAFQDILNFGGESSLFFTLDQWDLLSTPPTFSVSIPADRPGGMEDSSQKVLQVLVANFFCTKCALLSTLYLYFSSCSTPLGGWQMAYKVSLDPTGQRVGEATPFETVPDKRLRPYYVGAQNLSAGDVFWSTLYSDQQFPVMVSSAPIRDNVTGAFLGVNAVSQALGDLSNYSSLFDLKGGKRCSSLSP